MLLNHQYLIFNGRGNCKVYLSKQQKEIINKINMHKQNDFCKTRQIKIGGKTNE